MRLKKRITRGFVSQLSCLMQKLAGYLSLPMGIKLGSYLAGKAFYLLGKERQKTLHSLELALGKEKTSQELQQIAFSSYQNLGKSYFETLNFSKLSKDELWQLVKLEGKEHLEVALAQGKGVLCISAHLGNWELIPAYISRCLGKKSNVVARRINNEGINTSLLELRSQWGVNTILRDSGFATQRQILRVLARNEILGLLMDQDANVDGVFVDFFGRPAYTPKGPLILALATGAAILPIFTTRQADNTHKITFLPIYQINLTGDKKADILYNTAQLNQIIEAQIRQTPDQWVWMHQRWKRKPPSPAL